MVQTMILWNDSNTLKSIFSHTYVRGGGVRHSRSVERLQYMSMKASVNIVGWYRCNPLDRFHVMVQDPPTQYCAEHVTGGVF